MPWNGVVAGKPVGLMVELLNEATRHGAPTFVFHLGLPWARAQAAVREPSPGPVAIIPLTRTPEREASYRWIAELSPNELRLVSVGRPAALGSLEEAKTLKVGVPHGNAAIEGLQKSGFTKLDTSAADALENMKKLAAGRFDTIADAKMVFLYTWKQLGKNTKDLQEGPLVGQATHIYIAGDPSFPADVAEKIAKAIEAMHKDGSWQAIIDRWK
jgi:polar amino acid transport system substrate-binding protein